MIPPITKTKDPTKAHPQPGQPPTHEYRELTPEEITQVAKVFNDKGASLPDPRHSTFVGALEDGKVIGFLVLEVKLHAQPLWIDTGRSAIFPALCAAAEKVILEKVGSCWVYLFTQPGRMTQMALTQGMQVEPWTVLSKLVMPDVSQPVMSLMDEEEESQQLPLTLDDDTENEVLM